MRDTRYEIGSALILAVVLTSLLAIVGVMFVMVARVNRIATSAIAENRELNFAVETVVAEISQKLLLDVPNEPNQEYYDYPGQYDKWLASLEPYQSGTDYYWAHISDVYNKLGSQELWDLEAEIIPDYQDPFDPDKADADGDGVSDSIWIKLDNITTSKGKPIFAAIRIIDNGGMLNVNTAYKFDPNDPAVTAADIDGSSQMQIDLLALADRGSTPNPLDKLDDERFGSEPHILNNYIEDVVWRYNEPNGVYTPFDISDELKLRNRYILNYNLMTSRIEEFWANVYDVGPRTPIPTSAYPFSRWPNCTILGTVEPNDYDYRHISTIYNMDRIIDPAGGKMLNVSKAGISSLCSTIKRAIDVDPNFVDVNEVAAQIAVNLIDFRDNDLDVITTIDVNSITYYGFERPCIYISELAHSYSTPPPPDTNIYQSYAIELYKPYFEDRDPNNWLLVIDGNPISIDWSRGSRRFHVIRFQDPNVNAPELIVDFNDVNEPNDTDANDIYGYDPSVYAGSPYDAVYGSHFDSDSVISLRRDVGDSNYITVDSVGVPDWLVVTSDGVRSFQRDITLHRCIRRLWDPNERPPTLGSANNFIHPSPGVIQAHPANKDFTNVGEIGMVFRKSAYLEGDPDNWIGQSDTEANVRIDLADPNFQQLFKYLTVSSFDPTDDGIDNDGDGQKDAADTSGPEWKIPGRININTAPWYVIAQLPWVSDEIAQAIVAYRDKLDISGLIPSGPDYSSGRYDVIKDKIPDWLDQEDIREEWGFASIGELALVLSGSKDEYNEYSIDKFSKDNDDLDDYPDLSYPDYAEDDFEERDVIFARISNLVTVRSDVFTAYILVRIGADGPQKRVIAVFDRSDVYSADGKVKVRALHPVPDPR